MSKEQLSRRAFLGLGATATAAAAVAGLAGCSPKQEEPANVLAGTFR